MKNEEILNQLQEENIDSMFVYKPENIKYISDFYPSSFAYLIINKELQKKLIHNTKLKDLIKILSSVLHIFNY